MSCLFRKIKDNSGYTETNIQYKVNDAGFLPTFSGLVMQEIFPVKVH